MRDDLIFHIVNNEDWKSNINAGFYEPPSLQVDDVIYCCRGDNLQEIVNSKFRESGNILLLIIDTASLESDVKFNYEGGDGKKKTVVKGPVNIDAIIDKLKLEPEEDGSYFIQFESN